MAAQFHAFTTGGAVGHRLLGRRISAWWDKDGALLDAELIDSLGRSRKPNRRTLARLSEMGSRVVQQVRDQDAVAMRGGVL